MSSQFIKNNSLHIIIYSLLEIENKYTYERKHYTNIFNRLIYYKLTYMYLKVHVLEII